MNFRRPGWVLLGLAALAILGVSLFSVELSCTMKSKAPAVADANPVFTEPPKALMGWAGPEEVKKAAALVAAMPRFQIVGAPAGDDNAKKNVRLWEAAVALLGHHTPNYAQQTGDCVSFGAKNAIEYLMLVQMARGPPGEFHPIFPPHIYGGSRVTIGKGQLGRGAGSVGAWAADWVTSYGVMRADADGAPKYSGSLADQWGYRGVPKEWLDVGKDFKIRTTSPVRSAAEVRDAICNGYPCTVASGWGGLMTPQTVDGRLVNRRSGSWSHQMCIIGYDGQTGREPYWYVLNSWGENAHGVPPDGAPPGGFWVRKADVEVMCSAGDAFAFSSFEGFPAQELDFTLVRRQKNEKRPEHEKSYALAP